MFKVRQKQPKVAKKAAKKVAKKVSKKPVQRQTTRKMTTEAPKFEVKKVAVVGAGQMGNGIAIVAAHNSKLPVAVIDVSEVQLEKASKFAKDYFGKLVKKGKATQEDADASLARITYTNDNKTLAECNFAVEAATENVDLKLKIFKQMDELLPADAILATNTSSIPITKIAAATKRPQKVIGMHFMNPVPVQSMVEIIPGLETDPETLQATLDLATKMAKETGISKDRPGFVANRILMPYINEAFMVLQEGIASPEDIDNIMKKSCALPMGPLHLADFIGLDTCLSIMKVLHTDLGDSKYRPSPLLQQYVDAGRLGVKGGRGVFDYSQKQ
eukprot:UN04578